MEAGRIRVARNSLHHNSRDEKGYGVVVGHGAYALIEGNVFTHNRHAVASGGDPFSGYHARYNYVLEGGYSEDGYYNQHFDVQRDIYLWSMNDADLENIKDDPWISYLRGGNPDYPWEALQRELARSPS